MSGVNDFDLSDHDEMMMGVNDLAPKWRKVAEKHQREHERLWQQEEPPWINERIEHHGAAAEHRNWVSDELDDVARTAWHPVSDPPTEADGDAEGFVATWDGRKVDFQFWNTPKEYWGCRYWARINDVVLQPPA